MRVRIIFSVSERQNDHGTLTIKHFLAIQEKYGQQELQSALNYWYSSAQKDYNSLVDRYPLEGKLLDQDERLLKMKQWCMNMKIRATPTLFVNGKELPENYAVKDLKYFF